MAERIILPHDFPTHVDLFWPTLQALKQLGNSASIQEIEEKVIRLASYPESYQAILINPGESEEKTRARS